MNFTDENNLFRVSTHALSGMGIGTYSRVKARKLADKLCKNIHCNFLEEFSVTVPEVEGLPVYVQNGMGGAYTPIKNKLAAFLLDDEETVEEAVLLFRMMQYLALLELEVQDDSYCVNTLDPAWIGAAEECSVTERPTYHFHIDALPSDSKGLKARLELKNAYLPSYDTFVNVVVAVTGDKLVSRAVFPENHLQNVWQDEINLANRVNSNILELSQMAGGSEITATKSNGKLNFSIADKPMNDDMGELLLDTLNGLEGLTLCKASVYDAEAFSANKNKDSTLVIHPRGNSSHASFKIAGGRLPCTHNREVELMVSVQCDKTDLDAIEFNKDCMAA